MDKKTLSIVAYITLIGWIIALIQYNNQKSEEVRFHLKQSLGLMIFAVALSIAVTIMVTIVPALYFVSFINWGVIILWIIGVINAANQQQKELPLIGSFADKNLNFIQ